MAEFDANVRVACFSVCWDDVLAFEYFDGQLIIFFFYGGGNHDVFLGWNTGNRLGFKFHWGVILSQYWDAYLNVADDLAECHFDIWQGQPLVVDAMGTAVINGSNW